MNLPTEFKERMKNIIPNYNEFLDSLDKPNIKAIKVNTNKISVEEFKQIFPYEIEQIPYTEDGFYLKEEFKIGKHPYHHAGLFYSQDPSAQAPINLLDIKEDWKVLDLCASPGGKSIQIASKLKTGFLISNEYNTKRSQILYSNIERMGFNNVIITNSDSKDFKNNFEGFFDFIVIDAPCSGEGMFRKSSEAITEWSLENIEICIKRQKEILSNASKLVKTNGYILYSTCTYEIEENEKMVEWFVNNYNYEIKDFNKNVDNYSVKGLKTSVDTTKSRRFYPHISNGEGQFVCLLQNKNEVEEKINISENNLLNPNEIKIVNDFLINIDKEFNLRIINNKVFNEVYKKINNVKTVSSGVQIGEIKNNYFHPSHNCFTSYGKYFKNKCNLDINDKRLNEYLKGYEIEADVPDGWGVVCINNYVLGGYKATKGKLKNHYPKGLREQ